MLKLTIFRFIFLLQLGGVMHLYASQHKKVSSNKLEIERFFADSKLYKEILHRTKCLEIAQESSLRLTKLNPQLEDLGNIALQQALIMFIEPFKNNRIKTAKQLKKFLVPYTEDEPKNSSTQSARIFKLRKRFSLILPSLAFLLGQSIDDLLEKIYEKSNKINNAALNLLRIIVVNNNLVKKNNKAIDAVKKGLNSLLESSSKDIFTDPGEYGVSPLVLAAYYNSIETLQFLFENISYSDDWIGEALTIAAQVANLDALEILLKQKITKEFYVIALQNCHIDLKNIQKNKETVITDLALTQEEYKQKIKDYETSIELIIEKIMQESDNASKEVADTIARDLKKEAEVTTDSNSVETVKAANNGQQASSTSYKIPDESIHQSEIKIKEEKRMQEFKLLKHDNDNSVQAIKQILTSKTVNKVSKIKGDRAGNIYVTKESNSEYAMALMCFGRNIDECEHFLKIFQKNDQISYFTLIALRRSLIELISSFKENGITDPKMFIEKCLGKYVNYDKNILSDFVKNNKGMDVGKPYLAELLNTSCMLLGIKSINELLIQSYNQIKNFSRGDLEHFKNINRALIRLLSQKTEMTKDSATQKFLQSVKKGNYKDYFSKLDWYGIPALHYAAYYDCTYAIEVLASSLNLNIQDKFGLTPIMVAVMHGNIDSVKLLLKNKVNVLLKDKQGRTALDWAQLAAGIVQDSDLLQKYTQITTMLEDAGAKMGAKKNQEDAKTSEANDLEKLQQSIDKHEIKIVAQLLEKDPTCAHKKLPSGKKPIFAAIYALQKSTSDDSIIDLLLKYNPDLLVKYKDRFADEYALHLAQQFSSNPVLEEVTIKLRAARLGLQAHTFRNKQVKKTVFKRLQMNAKNNIQDYEKAKKFYNQHLERDTFNRLKAHYAEQVEYAQHQEKADQFRAEHHQKNLFNKWRSYTKDQKKKHNLNRKRAIEFAKQQIQQRMQTRLPELFKAWKAYGSAAQKRKKGGKKIAFAIIRIAQKSLNRWRLQTERIKQESLIASSKADEKELNELHAKNAQLQQNLNIAQAETKKLEELRENNNDLQRRPEDAQTSHLEAHTDLLDLQQKFKLLEYQRDELEREKARNQHQMEEDQQKKKSEQEFQDQQKAQAIFTEHMNYINQNGKKEFGRSPAEMDNIAKKEAGLINEIQWLENHTLNVERFWNNKAYYWDRSRGNRPDLIDLIFCPVCRKGCKIDYSKDQFDPAIGISSNYSVRKS